MLHFVSGLYRSRESNGGIVTNGIDIGKKKKPFTDSATVKERMLASIEEVVTDEKARKSIIDLSKQITISDTSNMMFRVPCIGHFQDTSRQTGEGQDDVLGYG